jgi:apolipoprotein N-acyltransferase
MTNEGLSGIKRPPLLHGMLAVVVSALALYLSTGLGVLWPLAWLAPVPVLIVAFEHSWRVAALVVFTAFFLGSLTIVTAYGPLAALLVVPSAMASAAGALATRWAARRMTASLAVFVFPAVVTTYEFVFALVSPHGTAWSLGYSQTDFLPLLQLVSLTGLWGVVFVLTLVPAAVALAWHRRSVAPLIPALSILVVTLGYGALRLRNVPEPASVRVGLAATDQGLPGAAITTDPAVAVAVAKAYADRIAHLARQGAEIVVLPEKLVGASPEGAKAVIKIFSAAARAAQVTVVAGLSRNGIQPRRNVALVFSPEGELIAEYDKRHLVPILEGAFAHGITPGLFAGPGAQWGVAICKDLDFPSWLRAYAQRGVRFLAVPAWDFVRDGRLHSRMAVVRGVENGFTIARSAQEGVVTFSDAYGRIVDERSSSTDPLLVQSISPGPGATVYTRYGDWFGWASLIMLVGLFAGVMVGSQTNTNSRSAG